MSNLKNGHRERQVKRQHRAMCKAKRLPCWLCHQPIDYDAAPGTPNAFESDHMYPVKTHPQFAYVLSALRPSHCSCNRSRGARPPEDTNVGDRWIPANW